jgi:arylsulfatase A-like enzyme
MARLTDPWEIIRRQAEPREAFDLDQIIQLYDGCVRRFDDELARILHHLKACGLDDNTIVVVYSDHGMDFFEHDTWGQGNSAISEHSARIPLLILDPRTPRGQRVDSVTRSIDMTPTLLDLVGVPVPAGLDGISLADCIRAGTPLPPLDAYNETGLWLTTIPGMPPGHLVYPDLLELLEIPVKASGTLAIKPEYWGRVVDAKDRMIRSGPWKLVYQPLESGFLASLYDVKADPECKHDLAGERPDIADQMLARLRGLMQATHHNAIN